MGADTGCYFGRCPVGVHTFGSTSDIMRKLRQADGCACMHLQVATSDGVLRAYTFGNMNPGAVAVVAPPRLLPPAPAALVAGTAGAAGAASLEGKAAAVALPSDGEEDWERVSQQSPPPWGHLCAPVHSAPPVPPLSQLLLAAGVAATGSLQGLPRMAIASQYRTFT